MQINTLKVALIDFNNLPQVTELLENCLNSKTKIKFELEIFEELNLKTAINEIDSIIKKVAIDLHIEKSQGYSGYRKVYNL